MNKKQASSNLTRRSALLAAGALVLSGNGLFFSTAWASPEVEKELEVLIEEELLEILKQRSILSYLASLNQ